MHEWFNIMRAAHRHSPYDVKLLSFQDFKVLKKQLTSKIFSNRTKSSAGVVKWLDVRWIRVTRDCPNKLQYKTDFDQPEFDVIEQPNCRNRKVWKKFPLCCAYRSAYLPISAKYVDLMGMVAKGDIPEQFAQFYKDLPHSKTVKDLTPSGTDDESVPDETE